MTRDGFEGPEKKVELVVVDGHPSLRLFGHAFWERVVRAAGAQVLSRRSSARFDAYLLSESSLFVYDGHLTLITCGRTRIVDAVDAVLERVSPEAVAFLSLERKNELFPREQPTSFEDDARHLARRLPGRALRFGREHSHCIQLFHTTLPYTPDANDTTLEVLMHGIVERADAFSGGCEQTLARIRDMGVCEVLPGFEVDDHVFSPAGYSLNALRDGLYYTVHVTPEDVGSYVSFETNYDFRADPVSLVRRVLEIFRPESFDVVGFVPGTGAPLTFEVPDYVLTQHVHEEVCGYGLTFLQFDRPPARPSAPTTVHL